MLRKHLATKLALLDLPHDRPKPRALKPEFEPADTGKQRADSHLLSISTACAAACLQSFLHSLSAKMFPLSIAARAP